MSISELSLSQLRPFENSIPELNGFISRVLADTYNDFVNAIYKDIDRIIYLMQENPELYTDDKEDRLTVGIKNQLRCMGYEASHDSKIGGHADLVVRKKEYIWIGEAKIHRDYEYLWQGFQQLNTRYSIGDSNQKDGGLLIYVFVQNTESVMTKWQNHLADQKLIGYTYICCPNRELCFFSTHQHDRTGKLFRVRHMPVILHFNPKDKSAEKRKTKPPIPEKTN